MPIYCYQCNECREKFEIKHSMSFDSQTCIACGSRSVFRIPSLSEIRHNTGMNQSSAPGKIVDEYIEETKKSIKQEKKSLKNREL